MARDIEAMSGFGGKADFIMAGRDFRF